MSEKTQTFHENSSSVSSAHFAKSPFVKTMKHLSKFQTHLSSKTDNLQGSVGKSTRNSDGRPFLWSDKYAQFTIRS